MVGAIYLDTTILIHNIANLTVGQTINMPGEEISKAIENLWRQKFFSDIQVVITSIEAEKMYLQINVVEQPRLSKYNFKGLSKNQSKNVKEEVKIKSGDIVNDYLKNKATTNIRNYYIGKGFSNVKVNVTELNDTAFRNSSLLVFDVEKGKKVRIKNITFEGNNHLAKSKLQRTLKDTKKFRWYFFQGGKFKEIEYADLLINADDSKRITSGWTKADVVTGKAGKLVSMEKSANASYKLTKSPSELLHIDDFQKTVTDFTNNFVK